MPHPTEQPSGSASKNSPDTLKSELTSRSIKDTFDKMKDQVSVAFSTVEKQSGLDADLVKEVSDSIQKKKESPEARKAFESLLKVAQEGEPEAINLLGKWANMKKGEFFWPNYIQRESKKTLVYIIDHSDPPQRDLALEALYPHTEQQKREMKEREAMRI